MSKITAIKLSTYSDDKAWTEFDIFREQVVAAPTEHFGALKIVTRMDEGNEVNEDLVALVQNAPELRDALAELVEAASKPEANRWAALNRALVVLNKVRE